MKDFFRKYAHSWFVLASLAAIAAIIACNIWYLLHGHCAAHDYLRVPMIGWALIIANIVAGMVLYCVKHRNRSKPDGTFCPSCYTDLRESWGFCPNCGEQRASISH